MKRTIFAAGALLLPMMALAGWAPEPVSITGYYVWDNGFAYIKASSHINPGSCSSTQYLALDTSQPNFKAIWAQVLTAHTAGQTVTLFYDGCVGTAPDSLPRIRAIAVPAVW